MSSTAFVSVVTPVYNGASFLAQCIESVLAQDYPFAEYLIVNNCSTDRTLEMAQHYAAQDARIHILTNEVFVNCEENHNNAFRQISGQSRYCKVVAADDRLLPGALGKMVRLAEQHPTVGIVGSYQESDGEIVSKGLPKEVTVLPGREVCRLSLLQRHVFGNPTSVLYRSDLVRRTLSFFPHSEPHADTSACFACLRDCDFGFIHEVLSVEGVHEGQVSSRVQRLGAYHPAYLDFLDQYGPWYLSEGELAARRAELLASYYRMLGAGLLKFKRRNFWEFHKQKLRQSGEDLKWGRVLMGAARELGSELRNPAAGLRKLKRALSERRQNGD